ncbi:type II CAAX endopeptidase family protein [Spirosoma sp. SC4-14]|uniref:type II CAAX endopeptidase family protein n=1 Tax=Spirosoma sp. SC4-14 TaxID=3128900 RepID=UPI0030CD6553
MSTSKVPVWRLARFFGLAYFISWLAWSPYYLPLNTPPSWLPYGHLLGSLGPMLASLILLYHERGFAGIRALAGGQRPGWPSLKWLLIGAGAPILLLLILIGIGLPSHPKAPNWQGLFLGQEFKFLSPVAYVLVNFFFFGMGEEIGWRGFALPRLQTRFSAFTANLVLTGFWALWHWPLFLNPLGGYIHMDIGGIVGWLFSLITGGILFTWLFNSSRGNVLACALFHSMMDVVFMADLNLPHISTYAGILVTLWGASVWLIYGRVTLSHSPKVTSNY